MRLSTIGLSVLSLWALGMVALAALGGYQLYSPVPLDDAWDGIVHFLQQPHLDNMSAWWSQHNEHRVVLSRLLFWLDDRYFSGASIFLLVVNYLCAAAAAYLFWRIVRRLSGTARADKAQVVMGLFIVAWLFQWMQVENFSRAFQSQFFLAQLLPLGALYLSFLAADLPKRRCLFGQSCLLGVLACGTMANGVLTLPLMTLYAVWLRQSKWRVLTLASLALVLCLLYFRHYTKPTGHGSLVQAVLHDPLGVMHYLLMYLGNPWYYLSGQRQLGGVIARLGGGVFIGLALRSAWWLWRQPVKQPLVIALFLYVLYISATALATAGGRECFGVAQALSSRYTTPMLMAWLALLLPYRPWNVKHRGGWLVWLVVAIMMSRQQTKILRIEPDALFQQKVAGLALELNIPDAEQLKAIYPVPLRIWGITQQAYDQQRSFFNRTPFVGLRHSLMRSVPVFDVAMVCQANISQWQVIGQGTHFARIEGDLSGGQGADVLRFLNEKQKIVGYAFTCPPSSQSSDKPWQYQGYVLDQPIKGLHVQALRHGNVVCQARL